jgi:very-short-patch-repair endonuclease
MLDKNENICLIDGTVHRSDTNRAIWQLSRYVGAYHSMKFEDYIRRYYFDNKHPLCACGCGEEVGFHKGWFHKYVDNHKSSVLVTDDVRNKMAAASQKQSGLIYRLDLCGISIAEAKSMYDAFVGFEVNFSDLTKQKGIDKRTIKKLWYDLALIEDKRVFENVCKKHQVIWQDRNNKAGGRQVIEDGLLVEIYAYLRKQETQHTITEVSTLFNIPVSPMVLYKRLCESFGGKLIDDLLRLGISSKPETEFYNVLKYFYGKRVSRNFKLKGKIYDFVVDGRLLIEYDGDYWHSQPGHMENDSRKDNIAQENGYQIFRVLDSEAKNVEVINKINSLIKMAHVAKFTK